MEENHKKVLWARYMEKFQDAINSALKYGFYIVKDGDVVDPSKHTVSIGADGVFKVDGQTLGANSVVRITTT